MERAACHEVDATLFEHNKIANHLIYASGIDNGIDKGAWNHRAMELIGVAN